MSQRFPASSSEDVVWVPNSKEGRNVALVFFVMFAIAVEAFSIWLCAYPATLTKAVPVIIVVLLAHVLCLLAITYKYGKYL
ncbi:MAG TPA: hypothetical protein VHF05_01980 [Candidatus Paceibacterota bacterium]|jgi:hypothetical protein|nr:hypothetical protein [Candidatus Paceibacterota bacterium]